MAGSCEKDATAVAVGESVALAEGVRLAVYEPVLEGVLLLVGESVGVGVGVSLLSDEGLAMEEVLARGETLVEADALLLVRARLEGVPLVVGEALRSSVADAAADALTRRDTRGDLLLLLDALALDDAVALTAKASRSAGASCRLRTRASGWPTRSPGQTNQD